jgi:hypothetical protein
MLRTVRLKTKRAGERKDYPLNYAKALRVDRRDVGDQLITGAHPDPSKHPTVTVIDGDVIVDAFGVVGTSLVIWLSGGTQLSQIDVTVSTAQGRRYVQRCILPIVP